MRAGSSHFYLLCHCPLLTNESGISYAGDMTDHRPIGYWLKLVDRLIDEHFDGTLDEHGVTRRQWQLLNLLGRGPATREELNDALSPFLGTDGTTASEIDELVESDWVAASPSGFALTPRGETAFERISEVVVRIRADLSQGLSDEEYTVTMRSLERMSRNLGWIEPGDRGTESSAG